MPHFDRRRFHRDVEAALSARGWSRSELARRSGLDLASTLAFLRGEVARPSADTVYGLASTLDLDLNGYVAP